MATEIANFLLAHAARDPVSFHMPGHKGARIYKRFGYESFLNNIMDCDITEIVGADNLFQTEGIIRRAQEDYARLYGVKNSYLLVNGTSGGIIAALLASVPQGKKLIMARNCHKSVFNALVLGGIEPVYAYPEMIEEYGISGKVQASEIERLLAENPDAEAVILPSPNYYGICSDIAEIARVVHAAGKVLIVDQAHGAHLRFFGKFGSECGEGKSCGDDSGFLLPRSAEESGADIVINSIHKTLASFTQSAVLNLNSDRVDRYILEDKLQAIESSSPSYLLMASLDISREILEAHGARLLCEWLENLEYFYRGAAEIPGLSVMGNPYSAGGAESSLSEKFCGFAEKSRNATEEKDRALFDLTKINLDMSACGLSGEELEKRLLEKDIFCELVTGDILMCMSGIGNVHRDYERLLEALREISSDGEKNAKRNSATAGNCAVSAADGGGLQSSELMPIPRYRQRCPLSEAAGRVCAASVIPYPPGIPIICPGEVFTEEMARHIEALRKSGKKVIGVNERLEVLVGR